MEIWLRMPEPISFFSEHTAEYVLVPNLINILKGRFSKVIPFYFWSTREGNTLSRISGFNSYFRLAAVFPRRPKVQSESDGQIRFKINSIIFETASKLDELRIPIFLGVPIVSSIFDLGNNTSCLWFNIRSNANSECDDIEIDVNISSSLPISDYDRTLIKGPLEKEDLYNVIHASSDIYEWNNAIDAIKSIGRQLSINRGYRSGFWAFSHYKPFYVMLFE